ncbi:methyl-accepting chemotaxis protein [Natrarchaeobius sp. A-rgal3]|uniref:methyl-accepting chemotaxis protein n=1 Tax=Natrarchaeobius versutus TaxID=1679078 RepID=UPI00350F5C92
MSSVMLGVFRKLVPQFVRRSYAMKFGIALLVLGLAVGTIGFVGTAQIQDGVQSNVYEDHAVLAHQQSESVGEFHSENERTVEAISRTGSLDEDPEEAQTYLEAEIRDHGGGDLGERHLHLLEVDGDVIASSKVEQGAELEGYWLEELETDGTYVTGAYESGDVDGNVGRIAYVTDAGGVPEDSVLVYTVPIDEYGVSSADGTYTMVVDERETIVFDEPGSDVLQSATSATLETYDEDAAPIESARGISSDGAGATEVGPASAFLSEDFFGPEEYVVGYSAVPGTDWVVLVHTPTELAYGFVDDVRLYGSLATVAAVVLIGGVGAVIGWNTSRSIDRLTRKAERMEEGDLDVDLESERIDSIGRLYDGFDNMRDSLKTQITEATEARQEAERARTETERINRHLETKADEYSEVMGVCAEGDLTARMDPESENEAMASIATEFNEMIAEIEETTATVKSFATEVATASEQVTASSEEVRSASEQVTESVQEISEGADRQSENLQSVTYEMDGLSTTIEEIAASSNEVADLAERTAQTGERGREAAQDALEGMTEIETGSEAAVEEIARLEREMEQIDELLEFITEVAEQTNMLALNANIEASRSADSSEGFSVVAGEVKDLAEETKNAAADIERRLERIKSQTDRAAEEVQQTSDRVTEHTDSVERAADALEEIADYAEETNGGIQEISEASDEQASSTQEVVAMVDDVAAIAEETSAESETVAAAAEEQTTALTEVSRSADDLAGRAGHLSATLEEFETDEGVSEERVPTLEAGGGSQIGDGETGGDGGTESDGERMDDGEDVSDTDTSGDGTTGSAADDSEPDGAADARGDDGVDARDRSSGDDPLDETFTFEQVEDET